MQGDNKMNLDFSFIRGTETSTEPPSRPTEAQESHSRTNYTPANNTPYRASQGLTEPTTDKELIDLAREIVYNYRISRQITEGAMLQLEKDLAEGKNNLTTLILYLTEALDRASGGGDQYYKRAKKALKAAGYN